jgi:uncharacterized protein (TIGR03000 family)
MLRHLTIQAGWTALAVLGSLLAAESAAAQEQGSWYSHPRGYSNSSSSSYSPPAYYYAPPPSFYAPASPNASNISPQRVSNYYTPSDSLSDRASQVSVHVPANAEVWFDGNPTQQRGERRTYVSPPLDSDKALHYDVRARWVDDNGRMVEQTRRVAVRAGQLSMVDFLLPESAATTNPKPAAAKLKSE